MTRYRIGVTGSGFMGRTHVDAAHKLDEAEPVAVTGGSRAAQLAADYGIDAEPDLETLLRRDDIDAVVIATPHWRHCEEALAAAEAGKHVLVEKPMATSLEDCDRMIEAFERRGLTLSVGYHQRFRESNRKAAELLRSGAIGAVHCIQMSALFDITKLRGDEGFGGAWSWWTDPRSLAHLINSGPHNIDLCRWWMQSELTSVAAQCDTFREENPNENTTMALLRFANGAMSTFWSSSVVPHPCFPGEEFRFRMMGERGILDLDPYDKLQLGANDAMEVVHQQPPVGHEESSSAFAWPRMRAYCDQMQAFLNTIAGQPGEQGTARDGRAGVEAVLAMLASAEQQTMVNLPVNR
ncbi:MAG: Gfo/Idh/MocA family oxidoreductase [Planctomycetales bacterium]|nr:Gfo/Idh/MocA family oxidoreductase [Planctomycetales bacterium]